MRLWISRFIFGKKRMSVEAAKREMLGYQHHLGKVERQITSLTRTKGAHFESGVTASDENSRLSAALKVKQTEERLRGLVRRQRALVLRIAAFDKVIGQRDDDRFYELFGKCSLGEVDLGDLATEYQDKAVARELQDERLRDFMHVVDESCNLAEHRTDPEISEVFDLMTETRDALDAGSETAMKEGLQKMDAALASEENLTAGQLEEEKA
ncbi:hypothetical protein ACFL6M_03635 [Candidatus Eisenbacteria bacterium]|uniref:Uncharacterized protein n=1 Tax=Eiseniibacteriota bacterium TaxID=2212470 RepID=A0ABV6YK13_UNCEI